VAAALDSRALIRGALDDLPVADRELLRLWAWEGLEISQIADVLGRSAGTTRVRLHRALRRLRAAAERGSDPGPALPLRPAAHPATVRSEA
jgi:RNA polymerase sigma-70 factor, ECF subfamily